MVVNFTLHLFNFPLKFLDQKWWFYQFSYFEIVNTRQKHLKLVYKMKINLDFFASCFEKFQQEQDSSSNFQTFNF